MIKAIKPEECLTKLNPHKIGKEIDRICGVVQDVIYQRSGSLLIVPKTADQTQALLNTTELFNNVKVQTSIAWSSELSYGKVYAPEFQEDSLESLLEILKPVGVVGVRKLFADPNNANIPLYVLTFLEKIPPQNIKVGYCRYNIDRYVASPLRCGNCCRYGHLAKVCRSDAICSSCSSKTHKKQGCTAEAPKCINCKGNHDAFSKDCPVYLREKEVCRLSSVRNISFSAARALLGGNQVRTTYNEPFVESLHSQINFPSLPLSTSQTQNSQVVYGNRKSGIITNRRGYNNRQEFSQPEQATSDSHWISQGQRCNIGEREVEGRRENSQITSTQEDLMTLPPVSPMYKRPGEDRDRSTLESTLITDAHTEQVKTSNAAEEQSWREDTNVGEAMLNLIVQMIPIIMKLMSSQITDKIECFLKLGKLLQADSVVMKSLEDLGLTSNSNSRLV